MRCYNNYSFSILLPLLLMPILDSKVLALSTSCQPNCGDITIPYPFGIGEGCYLNEWYKIECKNDTYPFLFKMGMAVVNISLPGDPHNFYDSRSYGSIRVKSPITSVGCSRDGKESGSVLNLTDSPFFIGTGNSLVAVGCNSKASLTNIEPSKVGCELNCTASKETLPNEIIPFFDKTGCSNNTLPYYNSVCTKNNGEDERSCDGNGCCQASPPDAEAQQVIGVNIESFDHGNSTKRECRVAFLTDEAYTISNAAKPEKLFAKGYAKVNLRWVIQTKNLSFLNSLRCQYTEGNDRFAYFDFPRTSCRCNRIIISQTNYANCGCSQGYRGNPYLLNGCNG